MIFYISFAGKFLNSDEINPDQVVNEVQEEHNTLEIRGCNFSWSDETEESESQDNEGVDGEDEQLSPESKFMLKDINLDIPQVFKSSLVQFIHNIPTFRFH